MDWTGLLWKLTALILTKKWFLYRRKKPDDGFYYAETTSLAELHCCVVFDSNVISYVIK